MSKILSRKIISVSLSSALFAILLSLVIPNPFGEKINAMPDYLSAFIIATPAYLIYSFPVILTYGVLTSIVSDIIGKAISTKTNNEKLEVIISGIFHLFFGLILLFYSLGASILFFITDRLLQKNNRKYHWSQAFKSLAIPILVWLTFSWIVYLEHLITNWRDYIL